ncbi:MAG: TonB-dependent receptor [Polyangiaceae bacterium]|jgi:outer membrane receptor protein involved in Fe transport
MTARASAAGSSVSAILIFVFVGVAPVRHARAEGAEGLSRSADAGALSSIDASTPAVAPDSTSATPSPPVSVTRAEPVYPADALSLPVAPAETTEQDLPTVVVTGKRVYHASILEPESVAASDSTTGQAELALRPRLRTENVLEAVPGLFTVQHAGGGKAQQYFMRGFDLDHGTDIAFFIDGAPINAVSHAHGQGFSDLHFIIPETIDTVESTKGPYSARVGDFATAGSVTFHMADHLKENLGRVEVGPDGHKRAVAAMSPDLGENWRLLAAAELFNENGPFIHPEDYNRFNGYVNVTRALDVESDVSLLLTAYGGTWNMSGVLPARAVCGEGDGTPRPVAYSGSHCLSRWDSVDPSQGGASQRFMALWSYRRHIERGDLEATAYAIHSNLQLFPNDGVAAAFQPAGIQYGSQIEQDDTRTEIGTNLRMSRTFALGSFAIRATAGLQVRDDAIDGALHRTEKRQRLDGMPGVPGPVWEGNINVTELGAYAEVDTHLTPWLRVVLAAREDRVDGALSNESATAMDQTSGYKGAEQFSPKASVIVYPRSWLDLFANFGRGFHTNDMRSVLVGPINGVQPTLIAQATGYEVGATIRPLPGLTVTAVGFLLDLTQELTVDGDTASTSPSGPTRRYGGEFVGRYQLGHGLFADATLTVAHARYTDAADAAAGATFVTLAPTRTFSAGVGAREPIGPVTVVASAFCRSMADRPATQNDSLVATGFTLFNAQVGLRWTHYEVGADVLNIGDVAWREGQFAVNSRLPGEGPNPPGGVSFTPGIPREVIAHGMVYW